MFRTTRLLFLAAMLTHATAMCADQIIEQQQQHHQPLLSTQQQRSDINLRLATAAERTAIAPRNALAILAQIESEQHALTSAQQALLLEHSGLAKWNIQDFAGSVQDGLALEGLGTRESNASMECLGVLLQVYGNWKLGKIQLAYSLLQRADHFPEAAISATARVKTLAARAQMETEQRRNTAAQETVAAAAGIARRSGDDVLLFQTTRAQVLLALAGNDPALAVATLERLLQLGRASPYRERLVRALDAEFAVAAATGQTARAGRALEDKLALMRALGLADAVGGALLDFAELQLKSKRYAEAVSLAEQALLMAPVRADAELATRAHVSHASGLIRLGKVADGKKEIAQLLASPQSETSLTPLLPQVILALTEAGDADASVELSARHRLIATREAMRLAKKEEGIMQHVETLTRENRVRMLEALAERYHRNIWLALAIAAAVGLLAALYLYLRLRASSRRLLETNLQLYAMSNRDFLTGLANRRCLENHVARMFEQPGGAAADGDGFVLLMDIDRFKQLNDQHGHAAGDEVLKTIAHRLSAVFGEGELLARWGGEEFLAVLPTRPVGEAADVALQVLSAVAGSPIEVKGVAHLVTLSAGICPVRLRLSDRRASWSEVLRLADDALYLAKENGRNKVYGIVRAAGLASGDVNAPDASLSVHAEQGTIILFEAACPP